MSNEVVVAIRQEKQSLGRAALKRKHVEGAAVGERHDRAAVDTSDVRPAREVRTRTPDIARREGPISTDASLDTDKILVRVGAPGIGVDPDVAQRVYDRGDVR